MFSEHYIQEILALIVTAVALFYAARHIVGWPKRKRPSKSEPPVKVGARLARGLKKRDHPGCH